jgi:hypothetical protein
LAFLLQPLAMLLITVLYPEFSPDGVRVMAMLPATGVARLIFGIVTSRGRTGMARRSRRLAILAALAGAPAGVALFLAAKLAHSMLARSSATNVHVHDPWPLLTAVVFAIVATILAAATGAVFGAERPEPAGFPIQPIESQPQATES